MKIFFPQMMNNTFFLKQVPDFSSKKITEYNLKLQIAPLTKHGTDLSLHRNPKKSFLKSIVQKLSLFFSLCKMKWCHTGVNTNNLDARVSVWQNGFDH